MTAVSRWACPCRMGSVIEMIGWWGGEAGARSDMNSRILFKWASPVLSSVFQGNHLQISHLLHAFHWDS